VSAISPFLELNRRLEQMAREIARRQRAEARLEQLNRELEARVQQEVAARDRIQERLAQSQRLEALGQLAAGIAHDFNNVLQAVSGGLALIQRRSEDGDMVRRFARMATDAAERGAAITGRLLAFARRGRLRAEAVDAGQLLAALCEMLAPTIGPGVEIKIEHGRNPPLLCVDRGQVETVIVNLAINARDAMPDGGLLTIAAVPEVVDAASGKIGGLTPGHYVRLTVSDTGTGMDLATLARAADPFFTTKPVGRGTGLGLPMARGFAHQSGGSFAIESTPSVGTTVTLWFPQAQTAPANAATVAHTDALLPATKPSRVMVVDDDTLVRNTLVSQLEDQGYQIVEASDGLAALALLDRNEPIDLLVTDFAMPGMNGLALIKEVHRRWPELPALLLTGYADAGVQHAIDDMKGWQPVLLRKPVRSDDLTERAAALLAPTPDTQLPIGTGANKQ
jgi:signal transduction histidine kinase/CheY-like chemotaxis protein